LSYVPEVEPALIERAETAVADLESALCELHHAIIALKLAFVQVYPPDGTPEWFDTWDSGRLGALWDRIEQLDFEKVTSAAAW
jgi:hypothetical protein